MKVLVIDEAYLVGRYPNPEEAMDVVAAIRERNNFRKSDRHLWAAHDDSESLVLDWTDEPGVKAFYFYGSSGGYDKALELGKKVCIVCPECLVGH